MERIAEIIRASAAAREATMAAILELQESTSSTSKESVHLEEVSVLDLFIITSPRKNELKQTLGVRINQLYFNIFVSRGNGSMKRRMKRSSHVKNALIIKNQTLW
jgi:hypothetical protein